MLINLDKYRARLNPSEEKKRNVQLHLPSHEAHNDTDICQKARLRAGETGSRDGVSNRHQSRGVVLMPAWFCAGLRDEAS